MTIRSTFDQIIQKIANRVGGEKAQEVERFLKFATVGVIGALVDFSVLNLLEATLLTPNGSDAALKVSIATGVAFTMAVISNFILNRYWTFPDSRSRPIQQQMMQFFVVSLVGLVFRIVFVTLSFHLLGEVGVSAFEALRIGRSFSEEATSRIGTNIAQAISIVIVMFWNFFANRYWTYNDVDNPPLREEPSPS